MRFVGEIVRLQVQEASLKVGRQPWRRYDPTPIRAVPKLSLTDGGVIGWSETGERLDDVHHAAHPASKNRNENDLSIGFTSHYAAMRRQFGDHLDDGIAGENILVATDQPLSEHDVRHGLAIETVGGELIRLDEVIVAAPCVEFSRYAMRFPSAARPDSTVTAALQYLDNGMRGYYAKYRGHDTPITLGDRLFVVGSRR